MNEVVLRIVGCALTAFLLCFSTLKGVGAMQQSGYKNGVFFKWLKRKDNLYFNRLWVLALCLALSSTVFSLCFSYLETRGALVASAIPFFTMLLIFWRVDAKYALKVPVKRTGRMMRLLAVYWLVTACIAYFLAAFLGFLSDWNGSFIYSLVAYVPFSAMPVLAPVCLALANAITAPFETARNEKFIKSAGQVLDETEIIRIGVVGSYGKTSVKNILKTLLSETFSVVETPENYNTPMGIAKTVHSLEFKEKQIFIAEMGARKVGDISELCKMVKPDYAVFTGICEQHTQTFGNLENIWTEKSKIFQSGAKKVFCGAELKERIGEEYSGIASVLPEGGTTDLGAAATAFTLRIYGQEIPVKTCLLGKAAVENIRLAAMVCAELGMTADAIVKGIEKLTYIPHRLELSESNGVYILDDGYNCSPKSAEEALAAVSRIAGRKCVVTPGSVDCGIWEEKINGELGAKIASYGYDKVILVGETLVGSVKKGYLSANGDPDNLESAKTLEKAQEILALWLQRGDAVLFLNDLPDVY